MKSRDFLPIGIMAAVLVAGGIFLNDASRRIDVLHADDGGIDTGYSYAQAYGLDQTWTIIIVLLFSIATCVFFLTVYPVLERRHRVNAARA